MNKIANVEFNLIFTERLLYAVRIWTVLSVDRAGMPLVPKNRIKVPVSGFKIHLRQNPCPDYDFT